MKPSQIAFGVSLFTLLGAAGCGTRSASFPAPAISTPDVTGGWLFTGSAATPFLAAALTEKAGVVQGTGTVYACSTTAEQTALAGTVSSAGEVMLQTGVLAEGPLLTFRGMLAQDGKSLGGLTVAASGAGCRLPASQKITAQVYAPAHGAYAGSFVGADGESTPVTATLSQSSTPGPGGSYALSGSVSFPNSPCLDTAAISSAASTVTGGALSAVYTATVAGQQVTISATGTADAAAANLAVSRWAITGGPCDGYSGTGSLAQGGQ